MGKERNNAKRELVTSNIDIIYHYAIEDGLGYKFSSGILMQNSSVTISSSETKKYFLDYFEKETGFRPFEKCPICGAITVLKKSVHGYFVGCSSYKLCNFIASKSKYYNAEECIDKLKREEDRINEATCFMKREGESLYNWISIHPKFLREEKTLIAQCLYQSTLTFKQAQRILTIYKKAENMGYHSPLTD